MKVPDAIAADGFTICDLCDGMFKVGREKLHAQTDPHKEAVAAKERESR